MDETPTVRVLQIDDDPDDVLLVGDMLAKARFAKYSLDHAASFEAGLEAVLRGEHDAYLVDYLLGARTGLDLIREALAAGCRAPLILLTGEGADAVDQAALQSGAADYLEKGAIDTDLLERSLRYAIERARR